jgi:photosynthetic reaction center cytochrome c subunit
MAKQFVLLGGSLLALTFAGFTDGAQVPTASLAAAPKTASQAFKNIQILKTIPADQLIPTMQFVSASLGVECDFCHVEAEMDKDDKKPKKVAREMMEMMLAINRNNFRGERRVTCNTCHRGSPHPQAIPAILAEPPKPSNVDNDQAEGATLESWPSGDTVLAKYIEVLGGQEALDKVTTRVEKGNVLMPGGRQLPIEVFAKSPAQRVSVLHTSTGDSVTAFNGQDGWLAAPGRPLKEMSASERDGARLDATVFFPTHVAAMFDELKLQPQPENVGSRSASLVVGLNKGQPPVNFYFDQQSGLLVRMVHYTDTALGLNPTQLDFSDYRESGRVKTPFRWTIARPSGSFTVQIDQLQDQVPIDAEKFTKPTPRPGATATPPTH